MLGDNTKGGSKLIEVKHLTKSYDGHPALDDLSFTIEKGRVYGFLGPNGAGKSTTMNIMTGYIGADSGEVLINGFDILKEPEKAKRSVGYLPEIPPLYPDMTVREYLSFVSELKEIPGKERAAQVDEVLSLVRLTDVSSRLIRNLSKGYRQRTGLAAAVLGFPEIIILDEPTVGLDPAAHPHTLQRSYDHSQLSYPGGGSGNLRLCPHYFKRAPDSRGYTKTTGRNVPWKG